MQNQSGFGPAPHSGRSLAPGVVQSAKKRARGHGFWGFQPTIACLNGVQEVVGSNPASPISRFSGETVLFEEVPEGRWGKWVFQRATESLPTSVLLCRDSLKEEGKEKVLQYLMTLRCFIQSPTPQ